MALTLGSCAEPGRLAEGLRGPYVEPPRRLWSASTPDPVTRETEALHFLWTYPSPVPGMPYHCELRAVDVPGAPAGTLFANAEGRTRPHHAAGLIDFEAPERGWEPGTYSAVVWMGEHPFGTVEFRVTGSSW